MIKIDTGFRDAAYNFGDITEKILDLEIANAYTSVIDNFRKKFLHNRLLKTVMERLDWETQLFQEREKSELYRQRLREIASKHNFLSTQEPNKLSSEELSLETYLLTGEVVSYSNQRNEENYYPTRVWDTVVRTRKIIEMVRQGKSHKDIKQCFDKMLRKQGIKHKVAISTIKKDVSKTYRRKSKENLKLLQKKA